MLQERGERRVFCSRSVALRPHAPPAPPARCRGTPGHGAGGSAPPGKPRSAAGGDASPSPGRLGSARAPIRVGYGLHEAAEHQRRICKGTGEMLSLVCRAIGFLCAPCEHLPPQGLPLPRSSPGWGPDWALLGRVLGKPAGEGGGRGMVTPAPRWAMGREPRCEGVGSQLQKCWDSSRRERQELAALPRGRRRPAPSSPCLNPSSAPLPAEPL